MDDFSAKAGVPNMFGLLKRTVLPHKKDAEFHDNHCRKERKAFMTVGSGGSTIITSVLQTILNVYEYNFSMQEAVNAPDFTINGYPI
jgi:gamma-glutamyltranspeptidase/glutathione hydrolase